MNNHIDCNYPNYSVVIPVYNSETSIQELCERIDSTFKQMKKHYEIILVDDASVDSTWQVLKSIKEHNNCVKIIQLMKNFGQHNAILCGFHYANGKYIITMDDDLQNPPEEIPKLINEVKKGYDVVIGAIDERQDRLYKKLGSIFIRYLNAKIFNRPKNLKLSSFRILTGAIVNELKLLKTQYPYISGMLLSITRNIGNVTVKHSPRKYGSSTYNLNKLIKLAFNLIINYTSLPLRVLAFFGLFISIFSFSMGIFFIIKKIMIQAIVPGWTTVVVLLSFFNGILLAILSVMGEYLARIIGEVSNKQQFVIREMHL